MSPNRTETLLCAMLALACGAPACGEANTPLAAHEAIVARSTNGPAVPTDLHALEQVARRGDAAAQFELATRYDRGEGVRQDRKAAFRLYDRAARAGDARAQFNAAIMLQYGVGTTRNPAHAAAWYAHSAAQGNAWAANNLGNLYLAGDQVSRDSAVAARLFRASAEGGSALGAFNLGLALFRGEGIETDYLDAYRWLTVAASGGEDMSPIARAKAEQVRAYLVSLMTPTQLRVARERMSAKAKQ